MSPFPPDIDIRSPPQVSQNRSRYYGPSPHGPGYYPPDAKQPLYPGSPDSRDHSPWRSYNKTLNDTYPQTTYPSFQLPSPLMPPPRDLDPMKGIDKSMDHQPSPPFTALHPSSSSSSDSHELLSQMPLFTSQKEKDEYLDKMWDHHEDDEKAENVGMIVGIVVGCVLFIVILIIVLCCWRNRRRKNRPGIMPIPPLGIKSSNEYEKYEQSPSLSSTDLWELDRSKLIVNYEKKLGSGAFCNVYKGRIIGEAPVVRVNGSRLRGTINLVDVDVAVKMLPAFADDIARSDFMQEINFMKSLSYHPHLVSMLGYVSDRKSPLLLVEYCEKGDLLHFIREKREEIVSGYQNTEGLKLKDILSFSWQIANGLEYLNSAGCIHRDIAARNVLVDRDNVCKIGDFGLCRLTDSLLYQARGGRLPLKWMAPEALANLEYSFKSDVWSYGVLLWELFSFGEVPFASLQTTELLGHLQRGHRLEKPEWCTDQVYEIMTRCWREDSDSRPTFSEVSADFAALLEHATESYGYLVAVPHNAIEHDEIELDDV